MLSLVYYDINVGIPIIVSILHVWIFFLKSNFFDFRVKTQKHEKITKFNILKKIHFYTYINLNIIYVFLWVLNTFFVRGYTTTTFWNHLSISNTQVYCILTVYLCLLVFLYVSSFLLHNNAVYSSDFFFAILHLGIILPVFLQINTLYSFIFVIEVISLIVFYKFTTGTIWNKTQITGVDDKIDFLKNPAPKNYLNMLFFQYWVSFFSSFLIFFSLLLILNFYGSSEFLLINFSSMVFKNMLSSNNLYVTYVWLPFFLGFFFKIGLTPFQLFKLEVYKGIPILSIMFYTTFYFIIYILYISLLLGVYLFEIKFLIQIFLISLLIIGTIYTSTLLFDITSLKTFFGYSTVINSLLFLYVIVI